MRNFAEIDKNNIVINVAGLNIPKNLASIGDTFVPEAEGYPLGLFYGPHIKGWVLDSNYDWQPPAEKPYPENFGEKNNLWYWNETNEDWLLAKKVEEAG